MMVRRLFVIRPGAVTLALVVWLGCELLAFVLVLGKIGWTGAVLVGVASTVLGLAMLRRVGASAIRSLRRSVQGAQPTPGGMLDGSLAALGAVLLILPGFLSDLVGLALAAPSVRQWLAHRFGAVARPGRPAVRPPTGTIDLGPGDWRAIEEIEEFRPDGEGNRNRLR
jgi:UPF0716 protein FxsA